MSDIPSALPEFEPGWVWLAGAGPGDPGLLTLLAWHGLTHADIVVYDALVSQEILAAVPRAIPREHAGKRGGKPSPTQADISLRLIVHARQGKRVLRLKGGDPMVFGRGGEEALHLAEAGIPFRIIPGISAGIGGLAYAGIPLTHRDTNSAVTFLTGHNAMGAVPDQIDWASVAKGSPVLVIYMALKHLAPIVERLIAGGRRADEPVAIVSDATLPTQRVVETTLAHAAQAAAAARIEPPAIVVVGEVVTLRRELDWLGRFVARRKVAAAP
jgi:uroporphyrin-III C-methyltransferase